MKVVEDIQRQTSPHSAPCIVYGTRTLTEEEHIALRWAARSGVTRYAPNPERLLDESALRSHRHEALRYAAQNDMLRKLRETDAVRAGKKLFFVAAERPTMF